MASPQSGVAIVNFLSQLRARGIERVAAAYAVAGWLLVQGASIVFPAFGAPAWALKLFIVASFALFPFVIWIAWVAAPASVVRDSDATRKWTRGDFVQLSLLAAVVLISLVQFVILRRTAPPILHTASAASEASIAVLPFENLSSDKDTGYFAAGIQDEILTRLARIRSLKVISRTSTQQFASRPGNLAEIARKLGVANILEGSVQKSGNKVRVDVQLIRAAGDDHIWAEIYDRDLTDVFSVESDVAGAVAAALAAKITPGERAAIAAKPTASPEAYDYYLRGLAAYNENTNPSLARATEYLAQAVKADPKYLQAWALLSRVSAFYYFSDGPAQTRTDALTALDHARALDPHATDTELAQGFYLYYVDLDYEAAQRQFEFVNTAAPNNANVLSALGMISRRVGQWSRSRSYFEQAVTVDPLDINWRQGLAHVLLLTHDYAAAIKVNEEILKRWPNDSYTTIALLTLYLQTGELDRASAVFAASGPEPAAIEPALEKAQYLRLTRRFKDGVTYIQARVAAVRALPATAGSDLVAMLIELGQFQELAGDAPGAQATYRQAIAICTTELKAHPDDPWLLMGEALARAGLGDGKGGEEEADRAIALRPISRDSLAGIYFEDDRVRLAARLGDAKYAIPALARLLATPSFLSPAILRLDPDFDALRNDPRFRKLENQPVVVYR